MKLLILEQNPVANPHSPAVLSSGVPIIKSVNGWATTKWEGETVSALYAPELVKKLGNDRMAIVDDNVLLQHCFDCLDDELKKWLNALTRYVRATFGALPALKVLIIFGIARRGWVGKDFAQRNKRIIAALLQVADELNVKIKAGVDLYIVDPAEPTEPKFCIEQINQSNALPMVMCFNTGIVGKPHQSATNPIPRPSATVQQILERYKIPEKVASNSTGAMNFDALLVKDRDTSQDRELEIFNALAAKAGLTTQPGQHPASSPDAPPVSTGNLPTVTNIQVGTYQRSNPNVFSGPAYMLQSGGSYDIVDKTHVGMARGINHEGGGAVTRLRVVRTQIKAMEYCCGWLAHIAEALFDSCVFESTGGGNALDPYALRGHIDRLTARNTTWRNAGQKACFRLYACMSALLEGCQFIGGPTWLGMGNAASSNSDGSGWSGGKNQTYRGCRFELLINATSTEIGAECDNLRFEDCNFEGGDGKVATIWQGAKNIVYAHCFHEGTALKASHLNDSSHGAAIQLTSSFFSPLSAPRRGSFRAGEFPLSMTERPTACMTKSPTTF